MMARRRGTQNSYFLRIIECFRITTCSGVDFNAMGSSAMTCPLVPENRSGRRRFASAVTGRVSYCPIHGGLEPWTIRRPVHNGGMEVLNDCAIRIDERVLPGVQVAVT